MSTVQPYFNCVSAGRNQSRMIKTLLVINDLFQDTLNFLLLIGPSESARGSPALLAYTHFKHHLIAWCDNSLSDDPVFIHKHSHYQAQTGHNLAKSWWNRNKHNVQCILINSGILAHADITNTLERKMLWGWVSLYEPYRQYKQGSRKRKEVNLLKQCISSSILEMTTHLGRTSSFRNVSFSQKERLE